MSLLLVQADARHLPFADGSVQTCVTSPPYWGLRDYGTATWAGGDVACDHAKDRSLGVASSGLQGGKGTTNHQQEASYRNECGKCGAQRIDAQLGLEPTPDAYVQGMVEVFREVRRVLRDDGTCWLNLGDSYAGGGNYRGITSENTSAKQSSNRGARGTSQLLGALGKTWDGMKAKDLVGIPWRVAFALQSDGWYLRSDIIWSKPAPMPESVTDRPTKSHEYLFLLAKQERYFFDAAAIAEPAIHAGKVVTLGEKSLSRGQATGMGVTASGNGVANSVTVTATRNVRSVWTINTQPYPGAHFATMPEKLVERCVLAGSKSGDIVLDPFMGSGTVARVALQLGRKAIGCDLNPAYLKLADDRTRVTYGLPLEVA